jgi:hypothetical protein
MWSPTQPLGLAGNGAGIVGDDRGTLYWKTGRHASRPRQPGICSAQLASTW